MFEIYEIYGVNLIQIICNIDKVIIKIISNLERVIHQIIVYGYGRTY